MRLETGRGGARARIASRTVTSATILYLGTFSPPLMWVLTLSSWGYTTTPAVPPHSAQCTPSSFMESSGEDSRGWGQGYFVFLGSFIYFLGTLYSTLHVSYLRE